MTELVIRVPKELILPDNDQFILKTIVQGASILTI